MSLPPIAVTCGEPAGIGLDLLPAIWSELRETVPFYVLADAQHVPTSVPTQIIETPEQALPLCRSALPVLHRPFGAARTPGQPQSGHAGHVISVIRDAVHQVQSGQAAGLCTLPIHKQALQDGAGFAFPGHTEFLGHLTGTSEAVMMLASPLLRVVPVTIHIPLSEVPQTLTADLLESTLRITRAALIHDFGIPNPRIAVAGLNPHAGENGKMGHEDHALIAPVLDHLRSEGFKLTGPLSADTMFHDRARAQYDAAVAMYHDQALIPIKTLDFDGGVNVTLGLPIVRTSPEHGTAFDIAGTDRGNPSSTIAALRMAWEMAQARAAR